jgi:putative DNA primase/helicase
MLGAANVCGPTLASLGTNFGLQPLLGKSLAIISDARLSGTHTSLVAERLLSISGEDAVTVDIKFKAPATVTLPTRVIIATNELPRVHDTSGALAARYLVMPMKQSFLGREDPGLSARLYGEVDSILHWAIEGRARLAERGCFKAPASSKKLMREIEKIGSPVKAFVNEQCDVGPAPAVVA